jgi:4-amino-4-deoxy-L-arabinose transferase-like glycosyltransferase
VVAALYPSLAVLGVALLSEPLFVALELAAIYAVLRRRRPGGSWGWLVAAGGLCGLAILTRANGAVLLLPLCLAVWTARPRLRPRALLAPAAVVAAAAVTVLPWTLRNASVLHAPVPVATDLGQTLAGTYNPASAAQHYRWRNTRHLPPVDAPALAHPEAKRSAALTRDGLAYLAAHPLAVVEASAYNTLRLLDADRVARSDLAGELRSRALARVSFAGFGALALLALGGLFTRRMRAAPRWLWLVPVLLWAGTVPFAVNFDRFRAPLDPFLILLAALALTVAGERVAQAGIRRAP